MASPRTLSLDRKTGCKDTVRCIFGLNKIELSIFVRLSKEGAMRAEDVAEAMEKDRSTAYRALQKLVRCGMCQKRPKNLDRGGCYYVYEAVPIEDIRNMARACADNMYENALHTLDTMEVMIQD
ncbi:MAG: helix-turn-helix domain-containing protein [Thermoplasmata archaeon]|nr:helix-turn-helix domain-containing protein [Thermoplasmata archaeon]